MLRSLHEQSRSSAGHGKLSQHSLSAEDFEILRWVAVACKDNNPCRLFELSPASGEVRAVPGYPEGLPTDDLLKKLEKMVERGLLSSFFDGKLLKCSKCGRASLTPKTGCPSCHSEDIQKSAVYVHTCGASIPESAIYSLNACPKCRDSLESSSVNVIDFRFLCNACGNLFYEPEAKVECYGCGWADNLKNADQIVLKRYTLTLEGRGLLESADPAKQLVRKLIAGGYDVREKVRVVGLSGSSHVLDVVAVKRDKSETRLYMVSYRLSAGDLIASTVKRLDIEKTAIDGAVGRFRWVVAGLEVDEAALKVAQTFGVEVEKI